MAERLGYARENVGMGNVFLHIAALPGRALAALLAVLTFLVDKLPVKIRMNILSNGPRVAAMLLYRIFKPRRYKKIKEELPYLLPFRQNGSQGPFLSLKNTVD